MFGIPLTPLLYIGAAAACISTAAVAVHQHDARIRAEDAAAVAAFTSAQQLQQARAVAATAMSEAADARNRAIAAATVKGTISHAPASLACATSPAVRAAVDSLRHVASGAGPGAPGNTGRPADVPGAAGAGRSQ